MKYLSIRKLHYKTQRKKHKEIDADLDDWIFSPYHCLKARFFIELSAMLVSILQYTSIKTFLANNCLQASLSFANGVNSADTTRSNVSEWWMEAPWDRAT